MRKLVVPFVACALLVACSSNDSSGGDTSKPAAQAGTVNKQSAVSATTGTISAVLQVTSPPAGGAPNGQASAASLQSAAQSTQSIVTPGAAGATAKSLEISHVVEQLLVHPQATPGGTTGTCDCTATGCTFKACTYGGIVTMDGTYSWGGGHVQCQGLTYTYDVTSGGATGSGSIDIECDMTVTATTLDGTFHSKGSSSGSYGGYSSTTASDTTITFKGVTFPASGGAPTAGSEHVDGTYTVTTTGSGSSAAPQTWGGTVDVTFPSSG